MLHTKFGGNRSTSSGEDFSEGFLPYNGHGGHLGHVTQMPQTYFCSPKHGVRTDRQTPDHGYTITKKCDAHMDGWMDG